MSVEFLDSNVLVYAFTSDPRAVIAQNLLDRRCMIGVQCLNEFTNVARRKLNMNWQETGEALAAIRAVCRAVIPMDVVTHEEAVRLAIRHNCSVFDSLMIATALSAGCDVIYSEDMHHGLVVDGKLRIVDPFRDA